MAERAHISSVEAIKEFRADLIVYLSKARPALEEISSEVMRTRVWIQNDQRVHWEGQVRRRTQALQEAQQALYGMRLGKGGDPKSEQQLAVQKAKRALEEAEAKLKLVKYWSRDFDNRVEPLSRQLDKLHTILSNEMLKAVSSLNSTIAALDAYTGVTPLASVNAPAEGEGAGADSTVENGGAGGGQAGAGQGGTVAANQS